MAKRQHLRGSGATSSGGPSLHNMRARALAKPGGPGGLANMVRCHEGGWRFLLSYDEGCRLWMFSAQLEPRRSTTDADWHFLGGACREVGMPPAVHAEGPMGDSIRTAPERVHKWFWTEPSAGGDS